VEETDDDDDDEDEVAVGPRSVPVCLSSRRAPWGSRMPGCWGQDGHGSCVQGNSAACWTNVAVKRLASGTHVSSPLGSPP